MGAVTRCISFTRDILKRINPVVDLSAADYINKHMQEYEINNAKRLAAFVAMTIIESGNYRATRENLKYSPSRALAVFGTRIGNLSNAQKLCADKTGRALANHVYGGRFGNTGPDDGWRYRGGGWIQTTFKSNYEELTKMTGIDFVKNPELIEVPDNACISAMVYWKANGCNEAADDLVFRFGQSTLSAPNGNLIVGKASFPKEAVLLRKRVNKAALDMTNFVFNLERAYAVLKPLFED